MKPIKYIFFIIATIFLFGYFGCNSHQPDIKPKPNDTTAVDTTAVDTTVIDTCHSELPIYYEANIELFECMNMLRPCDSYNYPMYPWTDSWSYSAYLNNRDTLQIPKEIVSAMSTQALIQAYWEFPMLFEIVASGQYINLFNQHMLNNNAYNELLSRNDACAALLKRLLLVKNTYTTSAAIDAPRGLEILISQPKFLDQYSEAEKKIIIETTLKNDSIRFSVFPIFRETAFFLIGRVLISANYQPFIDEINNNTMLYNCFYVDVYSHLHDIDIFNFDVLITGYANQYLNE